MADAPVAAGEEHGVPIALDSVAQPSSSPMPEPIFPDYSDDDEATMIAFPAVTNGQTSFPPVGSTLPPAPAFVQEAPAMRASTPMSTPETSLTQISHPAAPTPMQQPSGPHPMAPYAMQTTQNHQVNQPAAGLPYPSSGQVQSDSFSQPITAAGAFAPSPFPSQSSASVNWSPGAPDANGQIWQQASSMQQVQATDLSMRWYKFLLYFTCWANCILNVLNGITFIAPNDAYYSWISSASPYARVFDVVAGVLCLAAAAYSVYTRFRLAAYKEDAPLLVSLLAAVSNAPTVLSLLGIGVQNLSASGIGSLVSSIVGSIAWFFLNRLYFEKRASLFTNK